MASAYQLNKARIAGVLCLLVLVYILLQRPSPNLTTPPFRPGTPFVVDIRPNNTLEDHALSRRDVPGWEESIEKGNNLICAMEQPLNAPDPIVQQATWTSPNDLADKGWTLHEDAAEQKDIDSVSGLFSAFNAVGVTVTAAHWRKVNAVHSTETSEGLVMYPATNANFITWWNLQSDASAVIVKYSYGPAYMQSTNPLLNIDGNRQLPRLQKWSDIVWLVWQKLTASSLPSRSKLTHVFRYDVANSDSKAILRRAQGGGSDAGVADLPSLFPGWEFTPTTTPEAFKSIMSAPNAFGLAFLLAQHKGEEQFQVRTVDRINAFNCPSNIPGRPDLSKAQLCLYFRVVEVEGG